MTVYTSFDEIPRGHYRLVVSDIPWGFKNKNTGGSGKSGAGFHYPTMSLDEILALPIPDICAKDCVMFQWVPDSLLDVGIGVFKHCGFTCELPPVKTGGFLLHPPSIEAGPQARRRVPHLILPGLKTGVFTLRPLHPRKLKSGSGNPDRDLL